MLSRIEQPGSFTNCFFGAVTGDLSERLVDLEDDIARIGDKYGILQFKSGSGDAKVCLNLLLPGDVGNEAVPKYGTIRMLLW